MVVVEELLAFRADLDGILRAFVRRVVLLRVRVVRQRPERVARRRLVQRRRGRGRLERRDAAVRRGFQLRVCRERGERVVREGGYTSVPVSSIGRFGRFIGQLRFIGDVIAPKPRRAADELSGGGETAVRGFARSRRGLGRGCGTYR